MVATASNASSASSTSSMMIRAAELEEYEEGGRMCPDTENWSERLDSLSHTITLIIAFRQGNHISLDTFGDLGPTLSLQFPIFNATAAAAALY